MRLALRPGEFLFSSVQIARRIRFQRQETYWGAVLAIARRQPVEDSSHTVQPRVFPQWEKSDEFERPTILDGPLVGVPGPPLPPGGPFWAIAPRGAARGSAHSHRTAH